MEAERKVHCNRNRHSGKERHTRRQKEGQRECHERERLREKGSLGRVKDRERETERDCRAKERETERAQRYRETESEGQRVKDPHTQSRQHREHCRLHPIRTELLRFLPQMKAMTPFSVSQVSSQEISPRVASS